ncbi:MAG: hypothetical protein HQM12_16455 [SAR324 cluster bacterium]|nr:hypothetical protein [SAR324 cluster bacterium]
MPVLLFLILFFLQSSPAFSAEPSSIADNIQESTPDTLGQLQDTLKNKLGIEEDQVQSCVELHQKLKESRCVKAVSHLLSGSSLIIGGALKKATPAIIHKKTHSAALFSGYFIPSLNYNILLQSSFLGESNFGYDFSFGYSDFFAFRQLVLRDIQAEAIQQIEVDLGTFISAQMLFFTPRLFFSIGARDETPDRYLSMGIGGGLGLLSMRGHAYITEYVKNSNSDCHEAGIALVKKSIPKQQALEAMKSSCELNRFSEDRLSTSGSVFAGGRWGNLYVNGEINSIWVDTSHYLYVPLIMSVVVAYIVDF